MTEISEIVALAGSLRPREFAARIDLWRKGGLPGGIGEEMVKRSRSLPMPQLDRMDRELQLAMRTYSANLDDALRLLRTCVGLEDKYLFAIEVASKEMREMASDAESCLCSNTRELWERKKNRTPWRIKAGLGPCCYSSWAAAGRPDKMQWLHLMRKEQATA